jgi:hypothetical protein
LFGLNEELTPLPAKPLMDATELLSDPPPLDVVLLEFNKDDSSNLAFPCFSLPLPLGPSDIEFVPASSSCRSLAFCLSSFRFFLAAAASCSARLRRFRSALVILGPATGVSGSLFGNLAGLAGVDEGVSSLALRLLSSVDSIFFRSFLDSNAGLSIADESGCFKWAIGVAEEEGPA